MSEETEYLYLERENIPCWYELGWDAKKIAIAVRVHRDFAAIAKPIPNKCPSVRGVIKEFGFDRFFDSFCGDFSGNFGFNDSFIKQDEEGEFISFLVPVPQIEKPSLNRSFCRDCGGAGANEYIEGKCLSCRGTGKEHIIDWETAYSISASFSLFFALVSLAPEKGKITTCSRPQLILVDTETAQKMHGGSLDGTYSIPLARWLARHEPDTEITEMAKAMMAVWKKIFGRLSDYEKCDFRATIASENGWLNVSCPGDRCGLHPGSSYGPTKEEGYRFGCHNVDSPMQQITLLAGLGALCDKARKEMKNY